MCFQLVSLHPDCLFSFTDFLIGWLVTCRRDCSCQFPLYCQPTLTEVSCAPHELSVVQAASLEALQRSEDAALRALVICWPVSAVGPYLCQVPRNTRCETRTCAVPSGHPRDAGGDGCARGRVGGDEGDLLLGTGALGEAASRNLMFRQREVSRCETLLWLVGGWGRRLCLRVTCRSRVSLPISRERTSWRPNLKSNGIITCLPPPPPQMLITLASFLPQTLGEKTHRYVYARMLLSL